MEWMLVPLAYLLGSVQPGLILVRVLRRTDVRDAGSGKTGFTNVLRTAGKGVAAVVFILDVGKGMAAPLVVRVAASSDLVEACCAGAVMLGHVLPVFAGFRGGRGVATGLGAATGLFPWSAPIGLLTFLPVVLVTRYVSLGSIAGVLAVVIALVAGVALLGLPLPYAWFALALGPLVVWMHRDNIKRLINGTERRIGG